ncbi:hypothetical protein C0993_007953 [Termitomyces sp. T159_Od127]|nr:hypothetical protein C0993_007953 [Termitomyces sp. T159_Od127]
MTLARLGIKPTVIDADAYDSHQYGRADALQPRFDSHRDLLRIINSLIGRSMEVMQVGKKPPSIDNSEIIHHQQSFGAPLNQLEAMGKKIFGRSFWEISSESTRRTTLARFFPSFLDFEKDYALAVRQGLIEQVMIDDIERHCEDFEVQWNCEFLDMELPTMTSVSSTVLVRETRTGQIHKLAARYVVAADGGRSSVRRWAAPYGVQLEGETLPVTWCVLDAVNLRSNHPDLERLSVLRSGKGIVLVIPREPIDGKPSARFDIQLANSKQKATREEATQMIKDIFHPYKVDWDEVNWWSAYEAGLGLNTAFLEAHNLAWKMGLVLKGVAIPQILTTYGLERRSVAKELVNMDRRLVEIYAGLEKQSIDHYSDTSEWLSTLHTFQASHYAYQAGASIVYPRTLLTVSRKRLAVKVGKPDVIPGARTRPAVVTRLSDLVPVPIVSRFDGRFTLYFLVGDLSKNNGLEQLVNLDAFLRRPGSMFSRDDIPLVSPYRQTAPEAGAIFEHPMHSKWGVDPNVGSIVVVRPDGHIALKTIGFGVEEYQEVEAYFEGFLTPHGSERTSRKHREISLPNVETFSVL